MILPRLILGIYLLLGVVLLVGGMVYTVVKDNPRYRGIVR
jgi:hypothetical protein